jgi:hypothetical protein
MMAVLAHQGGWDEILLVLLPIAIFAGLLAVANRRASRMAATREEGAPGDGEGPAGPPPGRP